MDDMDSKKDSPHLPHRVVLAQKSGVEEVADT
jgi:hypothetical protein